MTGSVASGTPCIIPCSFGNFERSFETRGPDIVNMKIITVLHLKCLNSQFGVLHGPSIRHLVAILVHSTFVKYFKRVANFKTSFKGYKKLSDAEST